jgi:peptidoglycan LD-endopeptidase LytH
VRRTLLVALAALVVGCGQGRGESSPASTASPTATSPAATTIVVATTSEPTTTIASTSIASTTTISIPTAYVLPVARGGWGRTHATYAATDIFASCGTQIVAPVGGVVLEVRRENLWDSATDNPAHRGGLYVSVLGDDGVRYYMSHFEALEGGLEPSIEVAAGQPLGRMGATGRASGCHLHFGISPNCPDKEWAVRRGVVWPYPYLDAWKRGEADSPVAEVTQWLAANPDACALAAAEPTAAQS